MKKTKILFYLIFPLAFVNFYGLQEDSSPLSSSYKSAFSDEFSSVNISGAYNVEIECGGSNSYEIEANDKDKPKVNANVKDGTLYISHKKMATINLKQR